jgi:hypothetical protein
VEPENSYKEDQAGSTVLIGWDAVPARLEGLRRKLNGLRAVSKVQLENLIKENSPEHELSARNHIYTQTSVVNRHLEDLQLFKAQSTFDGQLDGIASHHAQNTTRNP